MSGIILIIQQSHLTIRSLRVSTVDTTHVTSCLILLTNNHNYNDHYSVYCLMQVYNYNGLILPLFNLLTCLFHKFICNFVFVFEYLACFYGHVQRYAALDQTNNSVNKHIDLPVYNIVYYLKGLFLFNIIMSASIQIAILTLYDCVIHISLYDFKTVSKRENKNK